MKENNMFATNIYQYTVEDINYALGVKNQKPLTDNEYFALVDELDNKVSNIIDTKALKIVQRLRKNKKCMNK